MILSDSYQKESSEMVASKDIRYPGCWATSFLFVVWCPSSLHTIYSIIDIFSAAAFFFKEIYNFWFFHLWNQESKIRKFCNRSNFFYLHFFKNLSKINQISVKQKIMLTSVDVFILFNCFCYQNFKRPSRRTKNKLLP